MKRTGAVVLKIVAAVVLSGPVALVGTWMLMPLWHEIERRGIEAVGHSGPAGWCYGASYAFILTAALLLVLWPRSRRALPPPP